VGWRGANLHLSPGGEGQPGEPAVGHQEDIHGCHILPQQMAGKRQIHFFFAIILYIISLKVQMCRI